MKITSIYRGSTKISKIYKGNTLVFEDTEVIPSINFVDTEEVIVLEDHPATLSFQNPQEINFVDNEEVITLEDHPATLVIQNVSENTTNRIADASDAAYYANVREGDLILGSATNENDCDISLSDWFDVPNMTGQERVLLLSSLSEVNRLRIYLDDLELLGSDRLLITNAGPIVDIPGTLSLYNGRGFRVTGKYEAGVSGTPGVEKAIRATGIYGQEYAYDPEFEDSYGVSHFEYDYLESFFAPESGIKIKNDSGTRHIMNSHVHHIKIYQCRDEGFYFGATSGSTRSRLIGFDWDNIEIVSPGLDGAQAVQWVSGRAHNCTIVNAARKWNNPQLGGSHDYGFSIGIHRMVGVDTDITIDHNIVAGAGRMGQIIVSKDVGAENGGFVNFMDNCMQYGRAAWNMYLSGGDIGTVQFRGLRNYSANHNYQYDEISTSQNDFNDSIRSSIFLCNIDGTPSETVTMVAEENHYDTSLTFGHVARNWSSSTPVIELANNVQEVIDPVLFRDAFDEDFDFSTMEEWSAFIYEEIDSPGTYRKGDPITYAQGEHACKNREWYVSLQDNNHDHDPEEPGSLWWAAVDFGGSYIPPMDFRVTLGSLWDTLQMGVGYDYQEVPTIDFVDSEEEIITVEDHPAILSIFDNNINFVGTEEVIVLEDHPAILVIEDVGVLESAFFSMALNSESIPGYASLVGDPITAQRQASQNGYTLTAMTGSQDTIPAGNWNQWGTNAAAGDNGSVPSGWNNPNFPAACARGFHLQYDDDDSKTINADPPRPQYVLQTPYPDASFIMQALGYRDNTSDARTLRIHIEGRNGIATAQVNTGQNKTTNAELTGLEPFEDGTFNVYFNRINGATYSWTYLNAIQFIPE